MRSNSPAYVYEPPLPCLVDLMQTCPFFELQSSTKQRAMILFCHSQWNSCFFFFLWFCAFVYAVITEQNPKYILYSIQIDKEGR